VNRDEIWWAVLEERERQSEKWGGVHAWGTGDCSSVRVRPEVKAVVLSEEAGEVSRAVLDGDPSQLRAELVQVAAVAVAWLESL